MGARNIGRAAAHSAVALAGAVGSRSTSRSGACSASSSGATPALRQALMWALGDDNGATSTLTFDASSSDANVTAGIATKSNVLAGSTVIVFVADENFNGSPAGSGAPFAVTISDSQGGTYTNLGYVTESADEDAMQVFARTNVAAGPLAVTCNWTTNQWHGLAVAEVSGVGASPTLTFIGAVTSNPTVGSADAISTGTHALGSSPALLVALGYNATDIAPSAGYPAPGTGFTNVMNGWNWNGKELTSSNNVATLEYRYLSNPGTTGATFTARTAGPNPENFPAITIAFQ